MARLVVGIFVFRFFFSFLFFSFIHSVCTVCWLCVSRDGDRKGLLYLVTLSSPSIPNRKSRRRRRNIHTMACNSNCPKRGIRLWVVTVYSSFFHSFDMWMDDDLAVDDWPRFICTYKLCGAGSLFFFSLQSQVADLKQSTEKIISSPDSWITVRWQSSHLFAQLSPCRTHIHTHIAAVRWGVQWRRRKGLLSGNVRRWRVVKWKNIGTNRCVKSSWEKKKKKKRQRHTKTSVKI